MKKLLLILALLMSQAVYAKETIRVIVSASPGGTIDKVGRAIQKELSNEDYNFVVEYKLGAGGIIAANYVADEKNVPIILVSSIGFITNADSAQAKYNLRSDFTYAKCMVVEPVFILVNSTSHIKNYNDFMSTALKEPMPYSTIGAGSSGQIIAEQFFKSSNFFNVPFKGGPESINALLSNIVVWTIESVFATEQLIESGKLTPIAVNSNARLSNFPNVPTFKELGLNDKGFKRMQLVALNSAFKNNLKEYTIKKLNTLNIGDENTLACPSSNNFIEDQHRIYKNLIK